MAAVCPAGPEPMMTWGTYGREWATGAIWRCNCRGDAAEREETIVRLRRADLENTVVGGSEGGQDGLITQVLSFTRSVSQRFDERFFQACRLLSWTTPSVSTRIPGGIC